MVHINGKDEAAAGMTVQDYLVNNGYPLEWIVVECNEEIVPKADYEVKQMQDGDTIEIVSFVGGG